MTLDKLLNGVNVLAVVCNQFGDTGKGKFSDYFSSEWADVCARGTGGNNAGHTVVVNGVKRIFHLLPCGIIHDCRGVVNILGNGMVLDLNVLGQELDLLESEGLTYNHLRISQDAHVIMPYHIARDKAKNQSQKEGGIGTTGRGIGPCYEDKIARRGIMVRDLFKRDVLAAKLRKNLEVYAEQQLDVHDIIDRLMPAVQKIRCFTSDTISEMHGFIRRGKNVLLEGAQGLFLSIEYGIYPYVTGSDCSVNGTAAGVGISARAVNLILGVVKFPYQTRVGGGPLVTEIAGIRGQEYCEDESHDIFYEVKTYLGMDIDLDEIRRLQKESKYEELSKHKKRAEEYIRANDNKILEMITSRDELMQNIGIRLRAGEYGATTGRPRRIGWVDAVAGKFAVGINGPVIALTKVDCLEGVNEYKICTGYSQNGSSTTDFARSADFLSSAIPKYISCSGYSSIESRHIPRNLRLGIEDYERITGGQVRVVSFGAERDQTIVL